MSCIHKHIPSVGILFSRVYLSVVIMFSIALSQNQPGTIAPSQFLSAAIQSESLVLIKSIFTCTPSVCPTCLSASTTLE